MKEEPVIQRIESESTTRSRGVIHNGVITAVVYGEKDPSLYAQARAALSDLDRLLVEYGSMKSKILTATVYIADMADKPEFNRAWDEWVDKAAAPVRACFAVTLDGDTLIEIIATAAV